MITDLRNIQPLSKNGHRVLDWFKNKRCVLLLGTGIDETYIDEISKDLHLNIVEVFVVLTREFGLTISPVNRALPTPSYERDYDFDWDEANESLIQREITRRLAVKNRRPSGEAREIQRIKSHARVNRG